MMIIRRYLVRAGVPSSVTWKGQTTANRALREVVSEASDQMKKEPRSRTCLQDQMEVASLLEPTPPRDLLWKSELELRGRRSSMSLEIRYFLVDL